MLVVVISFLGFSLLLYVLLGGADFGAGIVEAFASKKDDEADTVQRAIGPIWEANHMWLIIIVVILFMGFPGIYSLMSLVLHIPLTLMLLGIIFRGTAFTFRHYDAVKDNSQRYYSGIFHISSILTPLFFGMITASLMLGRISTESLSFYDKFIYPWFNLFCFSAGVFTCCLFAFLASIYIIGENEDPAKKVMYIKRAWRANIITIISGTLVFICASLDSFNLAELYINHPVSLAGVISATVSLPFLWYFLKRGDVLFSRILAAFQAAMIMASWFGIGFPLFINTKEGNVSLITSAAPPQVIEVLGWALLIGSLFILPFLFYLFKVFKIKKQPAQKN